jgi:hypothetical protein
MPRYHHARPARERDVGTPADSVRFRGWGQRGDDPGSAARTLIRGLQWPIDRVALVVDIIERAKGDPCG